MRNGNGVYTWAAKGENAPDKYEGQFKNNKKNGIGKLTYSNGESYYG